MKIHLDWESLQLSWDLEVELGICVDLVSKFKFGREKVHIAKLPHPPHPNTQSLQGMQWSQPYEYSQSMERDLIFKMLWTQERLAPWPGGQSVPSRIAAAI
jgi:hypothetical protein